MSDIHAHGALSTYAGDGKCVGAGLGCGVGAGDGAGDGTGVGACVGAGDGIGVGDSVGAGVGIGDGALVSHSGNVLAATVPPIIEQPDDEAKVNYKDAASQKTHVACCTHAWQFVPCELHGGAGVGARVGASVACVRAGVGGMVGGTGVGKGVGDSVGVGVGATDGGSRPGLCTYTNHTSPPTYQTC